MINRNVIKVVQDTVLEGPLPAKVVAQEIGKPYSTLLRELNPFDENAKLGVETLIKIMKVTRSVEPLRYMAEELGYTLAPCPSRQAEAPARPRREAAPFSQAKAGQAAML
mgnify:CR=1 FL=1